MNKKSKNITDPFESLIIDDLETLKLLIKRTDLPLFQVSAIKALSTTKGNSKEYSFTANFEGIIPRANSVEKHEIYFGAVINSARKLASYQLIVVKDNTTPYRLIHFDYEPKSLTQLARSLEPKPSYHLQFGGNPCPELAAKIGTENLSSLVATTIEKPRVPALPMSLASFINWLVWEYGLPIPSLKKLIEDGSWKNRVKDSEKSIILPFLNMLTSSPAGSSGIFEGIYNYG